MACENTLHLARRVQERTVQLEEANRELEAFSYSVSHDLRTPLRHIAGFVDFLGSSTTSTFSEEDRGYLGMISKSTKHMGQMIDELLEFSRMSRTEMWQTEVELDALVNEVLQQLQMETKGRNVEWKISPLPVVQADPFLLRHVFANLILNALKYSRPRDPAVIEIGSELKEGETVIFVRDNGVGFDMKYADKLFGVFQRLHRKEEFEGVGVGLANVRRIVARHGGKTWAEGRLDEGATFYFTLPPRGAAPAPEPSPSHPSNP